jgi:hypothetical protein
MTPATTFKFNARLNSMKTDYPYKSKKVQRGRWWYVAPDGKDGQWYGYYTWCNETIGKWCNINDGESPWEFMDDCFLFRREADLLMFKLRWE